MSKAQRNIAKTATKTGKMHFGTRILTRGVRLQRGPCSDSETRTTQAAQFQVGFLTLPWSAGAAFSGRDAIPRGA